MFCPLLIVPMSARISAFARNNQNQFRYHRINPYHTKSGDYSDHQKVRRVISVFRFLSLSRIAALLSTRTAQNKAEGRLPPRGRSAAAISLTSPSQTSPGDNSNHQQSIPAVTSRSAWPAGKHPHNKGQQYPPQQGENLQLGMSIVLNQWLFRSRGIPDSISNCSRKTISLKN